MGYISSWIKLTKAIDINQSDLLNKYDILGPLLGSKMRNMTKTQSLRLKSGGGCAGYMERKE